MEPTRKSSRSHSQKRTTFHLTSQEKESSDDQKPEQDKVKSKFASVARTVLLANRAFPPTRKLSRGASVVSTQSEGLSGKFVGVSSAASNSVDDRDSILYSDMAVENTFKMEPDEFFLSGKTHTIIREVLERNLKNKSYLAEESKRLSVQISDEIKMKVKEEAPVKRHKLVCVVWIGQVLGQGVHITSRCLWNDRHDNFAYESYKNDNLFAQASVFAVFVE